MENKDNSFEQLIDTKKDPDTKITSNLIKSAIQNFNQSIQLVYEKPNRSKIFVNNESLVEVALFLRNTFGLDHVESMSGTDFPNENEIEVNYHIGSYINQDLHPYVLNLATRVNRQNPKSNSLINIFSKWR